jgi:hypothetical protein
MTTLLLLLPLLLLLVLLLHVVVVAAGGCGAGVVVVCYPALLQLQNQVVGQGPGAGGVTLHTTTHTSHTPEQPSYKSARIS